MIEVLLIVLGLVLAGLIGAGICFLWVMGLIGSALRR